MPAQHRHENLMINLDELQEIDIQDPMVWPPWFTWLMGLVAAVALVGAGWYFVLQDQQKDLVKKQREETTLTQTYKSKAAMVASVSYTHLRAHET